MKPLTRSSIPGPVRLAAATVAAAAALAAASGAPAGSASSAPEAAPAAPAPPLGYFIEAVQARSATPPTCDERSKEYACVIERNAADSAGSRLLPIAEAVYPPRSLMADLAALEESEIGSDTAGVPLWWCRGTAARRIPYAVTRGALDHYLKLTNKYRDREYREPGAHRMFSSELVYRATIARRASFAIRDKDYADVYVASMAMSWTYDDGTFIPTVSARRTVVLSPRGDVLAVDGDGQAVENVTFSEHRGMGRQTELR
jgi:hypothetical protein